MLWEEKRRKESLSVVEDVRGGSLRAETCKMHKDEARTQGEEGLLRKGINTGKGLGQPAVSGTSSMLARLEHIVPRIRFQRRR